MRTLEATGKSIDEAIFNGLRELQISIDEVEIDIIQQETKGVFGIGAKPAIVRLIEREPEKIVIPDYVANKDMPRERRERRDNRERRDRREREPRPPRTPRAEAGQEPAEPSFAEPTEAEAASNGSAGAAEAAPRERRERRDNRERRDRNRGRRENYDSTPVLPREEINYSAEAAEGNAAADFLKGLLAAMGVEATVLASITEEGIRLRIDSASMGILIGHRGETLDAIQYLTSLCINRSRKETGYTRVTIDTEGYRDKREETLTRLARKIASQVKATGRARTLEPMNPYERRIIHSTIGAMQGVRSESKGEGADRRVVIYSTDPNASNLPERREGGRGRNDRGGRPGQGGYRGGPRRDGGHGRSDRNDRNDRGGKGGYRGGERRSSVPEREFADTPRPEGAEPMAPTRTHLIDDAEGLALYGKVEL